MNEHQHHHADSGLGAKDASGHDKHAGHSVSMFRDKFWLSLALTIPTVIWEPMIQEWFGYTAPHFPGSNFIPPLFGTIVFFYGGWVFLSSAIGELKTRLPGMMTLISLAISVAFIYSVAIFLGFDGHPLWWELATLVTIMLLGHWIEMRSISQAQGALNELAKLLPDMAVRVVEGDRTEEVAVSDLKADDVVLVRPGASIPADGIVISGKSSVNESMITGESALVDKSDSSEVLGGTVNGQGSLRVRVLQTGQDTALAGIMRLVSQAQSSRSRTQALADRAAYLLTIVAIVAGGATLLAWSLLGAEIDFTVTRMVTVLVIACPHALGLAVPLVTAISTTLGAQNGLLIRDRRGLEEARNLDTVVFDKTGTLTLGAHRVVEIVAAQGQDPDVALSLAAAVERDSEHPIAQALLKSAEDKGIGLPPSSDFQSAAGKGVEALVEGRRFAVGGPALLREREVTLDQNMENASRRIGDNGQAAIYLLEGDLVLAVFAIADQVRPESRAAVAKLQSMGIEVIILTGDSEAVARSVGRDLGIETVFSGVLPDQKSDKIKELQAQGKRVAMVGDGVNDAPALVTADVGVAMGAGTDVAVEAGDVVLVRSDPRDIARIVTLSRATYRKMIQNLWWAAGYNIVAIPLAAGVLYWAGIVLAPAVGAVLMSASTVIVAVNAQLLRRLDMAR
ncbi:heavy metal translocating P-type ATPase [Pelagibacterium lentulum]|uniref:Copper-translocating P-type ATPase n=3 Tax=Pelagibacterium lentulum TaxID=2029865 RepID=A0A916R9E6_9HYPH|nr:heavy metal translocating P-type ATPase [Pelagibacterium lentulum]GGA43394.1 copper-translocating P-type ATPase [Pelagibacterium lentulum]